MRVLPAPSPPVPPRLPRPRPLRRQRSVELADLHRLRTPVQRTSALRVVLADLKQRGTRADELDLRFDRQVIVRPATPTPGDTHSG